MLAHQVRLHKVPSWGSRSFTQECIVGPCQHARRSHRCGQVWSTFLHVLKSASALPVTGLWLKGGATLIVPVEVTRLSSSPGTLQVSSVCEDSCFIVALNKLVQACLHALTSLGTSQLFNHVCLDDSPRRRSTSARDILQQSVGLLVLRAVSELYCCVMCI